MSDKQPAPTAAAEAAPAPKSRMKLMIIGGVAILALAGGGGAFWWRSHSAAAAEGGEGAHHAAKVEEGGGLVPLEPFIVNLADPTGSHYLRTTLKLVVPDEKAAEKLAKNEVTVMRLRSAILELLSQQKAD